MPSAPGGSHARGHAAIFLAGLCILAIIELSVLLSSDIAQISQARHTAYEGGSQAPPPLPAIPKVALLFLIKTTLPTEPVWRLFFDSAAAAASKLTSSGSQAGWELLFSVYVHPAAEHSLPSDSWFAGREVSGRQATVWGNHSLVDAERALLRAALRDPLNQRFALLSESCIPLYSGPAVYAQLMWEQRSRINACRLPDDPKDDAKRMLGRYNLGMLRHGVKREHWRKSSQWFMLTRKHAEAVVGDTRVDEAFRRHCWVASDWKQRFCVADEHYIPTLLAYLNLEAEAACDAVLTYTQWRGGAPHPTTFDKATTELLAQLRGGCNATVLETASAEGVAMLLEQAAGWWRMARREGAGAGAADGSGSSSGGMVGLLPPSCPLFARKIDAASMQSWEELLKPVMNDG